MDVAGVVYVHLMLGQDRHQLALDRAEQRPHRLLAGLSAALGRDKLVTGSGVHLGLLAVVISGRGALEQKPSDAVVFPLGRDQIAGDSVVEQRKV